MTSDEEPLLITPEMLLGRRVDFERRMRRVPPFTLALIGLLALILAGQVAAGSLASREAIIAAGALDAASVRAGQYWRLVSATFLHGGVDHLVSNAIGLFIVGMVCEHAFGWRQLAVLYLVSAVAGSVLSVSTSPGPSVGASGAIFGLEASVIVLFRRHRDRLLMRDRRIGLVLLVWVVYSIASGLANPLIDNAAHLGGAVGGGLFTRWWLHPVALEPMPPEQARRVKLGLWLVAAVLTYTVAGWVAAHTPGSRGHP